jgi:hypothetical protein
MSVSTFLKSWVKIFTKKKPLAVVVTPAVMTVKLPAVEPKMLNKKTDAEIAEDEIWEKKWTDKRIKAAEIHKDIANDYLSVDGTRVSLDSLFECFNIRNWSDRERFYCAGWIECHSTWDMEIRKSKICKNEPIDKDDMVRMLYGWGRIFFKVQDLKSELINSWVDKINPKIGDIFDDQGYTWKFMSDKTWRKIGSGSETKIVNFTFSKEVTIEGLRKVRDKSPKVWERLLKDDMDGPICDEILQYIVYDDVIWG